MIYFIHSTEGKIKIGWTGTTPETRLAQLQGDCPHKLTLLGTIHGSTDKERSLHHLFREFHAGGEWFTETPEIYDYLEKQASVPEGTKDSEPLPLRKILERLGKQIRNARLKRRIRACDIAARANMSRTTLHQIEHGQGHTSMMNYVKVLHTLGLESDLLAVADAKTDEVGLDLAREALPKRIRS